MRKVLSILVVIIFVACGGSERYDVIVVGGGTSGVAAGLQSSRMGVKTLIVEEHDWLGGMLTSAGVSATDGNYNLRGGLWGEFRDSLEAHYGGAEALKTGWVSHVLFEPSVGNRIFKNMAANESNLDVWYRSKPVTIAKNSDGSWDVIIAKDGKMVEIVADVLIDATELGDVAKSLGVTYDVGMDSKVSTNEDIAPEVANKIIQDLTYAVVLKDYGRDVTISEPKGYNADDFACACKNKRCITPKEKNRLWSREKMITYGKLPNNKYMINWPLEGNDYYIDMVEMSEQEREEAEAKAKNFTLCFLYFIQTELGFNTLALADDEFPTEDKMPFIPYHRESRRIHGVVQFTLNHITNPYTQPQKLYRTVIGVGDYPVDQHHARYSGWMDLPNLYYYSIPSYGLPMGVLMPKDVKGLLVAEKSISVTNIVNGSTRLQPVVLQIGAASGTIAALAVKQGLAIEDVDVRSVQKAILETKGYLLPYLDMPQHDSRFGAMQRIGATGIIKGESVNKDWANQTWFRADSLIANSILSRGLSECYAQIEPLEDSSMTTVASLESMVGKIAINADVRAAWDRLDLGEFDVDRALTRIECALLIDDILDPFTTIEIDIYGNYKL